MYKYLVPSIFNHATPNKAIMFKGDHLILSFI